MVKRIKLPSGKTTTKKAHWVKLPNNQYVKRAYVKPIIKKGKFAGWKTIRVERKFVSRKPRAKRR